MPRTARVVVPGLPHHVIQRGNRNQVVFFSSSDKIRYLGFLKDKIKEHGVAIWAYCLMDNHVHFVAVPRKNDSFSNAFGQTHKLYTHQINARRNWRGHLWQGRFHSFPMDEKYQYAAIRYVENNPVRAGLVQRAQDYEFSSAKSHVYKLNNSVLTKSYLQEDILDWGAYLAENDDEREENIRKNLQVNRPMGSTDFVKKIERQLQRSFVRKKPGPKGPRIHNSVHVPLISSNNSVHVPTIR